MSDTDDTTAKSNSEIPERQLRLKEALEGQFSEALEELDSLAWKEFGLRYNLAADKALEVFTGLRNLDAFKFDFLVDLTCIDWLDRREPRFDVVYHLLSIEHKHRLCLVVSASEDNPEVESVLSLWAGANFMEREVWDMFGVSFKNHGNLRRILMYDEFVGHPLRKDYPIRGKQPRVPLRIPELRNTSADLHKEQLVALPTRRGSAAKDR